MDPTILRRVQRRFSYAGRTDLDDQESVAVDPQSLEARYSGPRRGITQNLPPEVQHAEVLIAENASFASVVGTMATRTKIAQQNTGSRRGRQIPRRFTDTALYVGEVIPEDVEPDVEAHISETEIEPVVMSCHRFTDSALNTRAVFPEHMNSATVDGAESSETKASPMYTQLEIPHRHTCLALNTRRVVPEYIYPSTAAKSETPQTKTSSTTIAPQREITSHHTDSALHVRGVFPEHIRPAAVAEVQVPETKTSPSNISSWREIRRHVTNTALNTRAIIPEQMNYVAAVKVQAPETETLAIELPTRRELYCCFTDTTSRRAFSTCIQPTVENEAKSPKMEPLSTLAAFCTEVRPRLTDPALDTRGHFQERIEHARTCVVEEAVVQSEASSMHSATPHELNRRHTDKVLHTREASTKHIQPVAEARIPETEESPPITTPRRLIHHHCSDGDILGNSHSTNP